MTILVVILTRSRILLFLSRIVWEGLLPRRFVLTSFIAIVEQPDSDSLLGIYDGETRPHMCGVGKEDISSCVPRHSS
jgi:hypothetical protein